MISTLAVRATRLALMLAMFSAIVVLSPTASAQPESPVWGKIAVPAPERTDEGDWDGTWWSVSRDHKIAMWIKTLDGVPQVKIRYLGKSTTEGFTTDWNTKATYLVRGKKGSFEIEFDRRDENTMTGSWRWELSKGQSKRVETAKIEIYRAKLGRMLVIKFDELQRAYEGTEKPAVLAIDKKVWTFRKASRREAPWGELPF